MSNGISFSQSGVPLRRAADYQKTIDSRWKVLEVEVEKNITIKMPSVPGTGTSVSPYSDFSQKIKLFDHKLGFFPFFEYSTSVVEGELAFAQYVGDVYADKNGVYIFPSYQYESGQNPVTIVVRVRVYNLDADKEYTAPALEANIASAVKPGGFGAKFLDDTGQSSIFDSSPVGFSLDTTKKIIGIHKVIIKDITITDNTIEHDAGFPPSYLMCLAVRQPFKSFDDSYNIPYRDDYYIGPLGVEAVYYPRVKANPVTMSFTGVQAVFQGRFAFVILKDPLELAL